MKLPSYRVEFLPLERRLFERRRTNGAPGLFCQEHRRGERRQLTESGEQSTPLGRCTIRRTF